MTKRSFMYVGDHPSVAMYGVTFPAGKAVEVDSNEQAVLFGKLSGNNHFLAVGADSGTMSEGNKGPSNGNVSVHTQPQATARQGGTAAGNQSRGK